MGQIKTDGKVIISTKLDNSGLKKDIAQLPSSMKGIKSSLIKIAGLMASAFSVTAIVNFGKKAIELGSDLAEVQNVVDVTFGSMSSTVNKFAKDAMKSYGLSEKVAKQYMGTFGAMSKAFGYTTSAAYEQAAALTGLTGDVASFYNLSTDEAFTKLKSVYTGETESLKDLGIVMTQTALDEFALQKGMGKTTKSMSEQEKVALRLAFVTERLSGASGDFQRTSDGWANQTRVLSLQFESLQATIGQGLINILTPGLRLLNELIAKLQIVADKFKELTEIFFGHSEGTASGMSAVAQSTGEISDNFDSATESAKKLNRQLAGFDKLNKLGNDEANSSESGGLQGASGSLGNVTIDTEQAEESASRLKSVLQNVKTEFQDFFGWLKQSDFGIAFENIKETGKNLVPILSNSFSNSKQSIEGFLKETFNMLVIYGELYVEVYGDIFRTITENIRNWVPENEKEIEAALSSSLGIFFRFNEQTSQITGDVFKNLRDFWREYGEPIVDWVSNAGLDIISFLMSFYNDVLVPVTEEAMTWVDKIWKENLEGVVQEVLGFVGRIGELLGLLWNYAIKPVLNFIKNNIFPILLPILQGVQNTVMDAVNHIVSTVKFLISILNGLLDIVIGLLTGDWDRAWSGAKKIFESFKDWIFSTIDFIKNTFVHSFNSIKDTVVAIFSAISSAAKEKINFVLGHIEGMVNGIINGINWLIRKLNSLGTINLPEILGGGSIGFNLKELSTVSIPRLAQGAVIPANKEFLAVLGDQKNGRNLELPESLLRQIVREESGNGKNGGGTFIIQVVLKGKVIGEQAVEYVNGVIRKTGKSPIKQGG